MRSKGLWLACIVSCLFIFGFSSTSTSAQTRIRFARGRTSTSISGTLAPGARRTYVLGATRGQQLSGNVSSRGDCVKFTEASTSTSFTTDYGDNRLSITNYCRSTVAYTMTVSINY